MPSVKTAAKLVYVNASGSRKNGGVLVSKRVDQVFADWQETDLTEKTMVEEAPNTKQADQDDGATMQLLAKTQL